MVRTSIAMVTASAASSIAGGDNLCRPRGRQQARDHRGKVVEVTMGTLGLCCRNLTAALLAIGLWLSAPSSALAQKTPEKIRLTPQSKEGAVLVRVDTILAPHQLWFQKVGSSGFGSRVYVIDVPARPRSEIYVARTLSPGRYRLTSIWQQERWGLLFPQDTFDFEVKPGNVIFLGKLETAPLLAALAREVVAAGKTESSAPGIGFSTDRHGQRPELNDRNEAGLAQARAFAEETMKSSPAMVELGSVNLSIGTESHR